MNTDDTQGIQQDGREKEVREEDDLWEKECRESEGGSTIEEATEKFRVFIYTLADEFGRIRYVGKTINPLQRFQYHCYANGRSHKDNWIKSLLSAGKKPIMEIIEEIDCECDADWHEVEMFWISYFRFLGFNLTNIENGGQGPGRVANETRAKMSAARKGKPTGIPMPPELKEKLIASHAGVPWTEESKEKLRKTMKATNAVQRLQDAPRPEHAWNKGIPSSEETKAKQSATHKLIGTGTGPKSPEHRKKLSQANMGKKPSEETLAKMRGPRGPNIRTLRKQGLAPPKDQPPSDPCTS